MQPIFALIRPAQRVLSRLAASAHPEQQPHDEKRAADDQISDQAVVGEHRPRHDRRCDKKGAAQSFIGLSQNQDRDQHKARDEKHEEGYNQLRSRVALTKNVERKAAEKQNAQNADNPRRIMKEPVICLRRHSVFLSDAAISGMTPTG